jgi:hypothetical protein
VVLRFLPAPLVEDDTDKEVIDAAVFDVDIPPFDVGGAGDANCCSDDDDDADEDVFCCIVVVVVAPVTALLVIFIFLLHTTVKIKIKIKNLTITCCCNDIIIVFTVNIIIYCQTSSVVQFDVRLSSSSASRVLVDALVIFWGLFFDFLRTVFDLLTLRLNLKTYLR